ncbi:hypothetical protein AAUPMB_11841, partial [Pasteurella multocida subsp. multocida str. Anand1_buffalo]
MEQGKRYDQACREIYGHHYGEANQKTSQLLPAIPAQ